MYIYIINIYSEGSCIAKRSHWKNKSYRVWIREYETKAYPNLIPVGRRKPEGHWPLWNILIARARASVSWSSSLLVRLAGLLLGRIVGWSVTNWSGHGDWSSSALFQFDQMEAPLEDFGVIPVKGFHERSSIVTVFSSGPIAILLAGGAVWPARLFSDDSCPDRAMSKARFHLPATGGCVGVVDRLVVCSTDAG